MAAEGIAMLRDVMEAQLKLMQSLRDIAVALHRMEDKQDEIMTRLQSLEALVIDAASGP